MLCIIQWFGDERIRQDFIGKGMTALSAGLWGTVTYYKQGSQ
jgi:hypothetical protein